MKRIFPWLLAGLITLVGLGHTVFALQNIDFALANLIEIIGFLLNVALIAILGALIVYRQTGNRIGWMMMAVALVTALPFLYDPAFIMVIFPAAPTTLTLRVWLLLWLQGWYWLLQMVLIFQIVLRFPAGDLLSRRWNWLNTVTLGIVIVAALWAVFPDQIGPINGAWNLENPAGLILGGVYDGIALIWVIGLLTLAGGSLASLLMRYRRGNEVTRQQVKWLLFAGGIQVFLVIFGLAYFSTYNASPVWLNILVQIGFMTLPLAIANAILRYRLYDIDIIIRRTLSYSILTAVLGLVYFGGVVLLQNLSRGLFGADDSPLITVISTLAIAALFNPLRGRIQTFIDRRFFRSKYDAEKALSEFAAVSRDEVDMGRLSGSLLAVVEDTMQPDQTSLWLRESTDQE